MTSLTHLPVPPAVPLLGQLTSEAQRSLLPQGKGYRRCTGQAHTPGLRVMWDQLSDSVTGDGLQPAQVQQYLLHRPGRVTYSTRDAPV